jgi:hypothetical protein
VRDEKGWEGEPLIKREKKVEEMRPIIHLTQSLWKPKARRISLMNFQLNLSKDLDMSKFNEHPWGFGDFQGVRNFMSQKNIVKDLSPLHISWIASGNQIR